MEFDIWIKNGHIIDGSGNPWFKADVGVKDDKIEFIGNSKNIEATKVIDAKNRIIAPGFIDIHSHSDYASLIDPFTQSTIRQGVTTQIVGNCGNSAAPMNEEVKAYRLKHMQEEVAHIRGFNWRTMREYITTVSKRGTSINIAPLVGHGTIRHNVIGLENRSPTDSELVEMKKLVTEAMDDGAWGLSSGLIYTPGLFADTNEIIELAKVAAEYDGLYTTHVRGEADTVIDAIKEAIVIGEKAGVKVQYSHAKFSRRTNWGKSKTALELIESARNRGIDITFDQYPYTAWSTDLGSFLPEWVKDGGTEAMLQRLEDPLTRARISGSPLDYPEWKDLQIVSSPKHPKYEGKMVADVAVLEKKKPVDAAFDLIISEEGSVPVIGHSLNEEDVRRLMKSPYMMVGSDSRAMAPDNILGKGMPHPRNYGTFPRVIGHYVREGVLSLQDAVRKMTSFPAQRIGIKDRGLLNYGYKADIVVFDPVNVNDESTFMNPHKYAIGIDYVIVNGEIVINKGKHTGVTPGMVLTK